MSLIDNAMKKYGYKKIEENKYGVYYQKREAQRYDHVVCISHKESGRHLFQSYDKEVHNVNGNFFNSVCGVEIPVLVLMWLKAKWLGIKYHW